MAKTADYNECIGIVGIETPKKYIGSSIGFLTNGGHVLSK